MSQLPHARNFRDLITYLNSELAEIGRMLNSMMEKADSFCGDPSSALHESVAEYYTSTTETDD